MPAAVVSSAIAFSFVKTSFEGFLREHRAPPPPEPTTKCGGGQFGELFCVLLPWEVGGLACLRHTIGGGLRCKHCSKLHCGELAAVCHCSETLEVGCSTLAWTLTLTLCFTCKSTARPRLRAAERALP